MARGKLQFSKMPKAPRRSRSSKSKVLVNWLPVIDMMLRQGQFTLTRLVTLYQTSKAVQALFTNFWMLLETRFSHYQLVFVPDISTWRTFFRCFKTRVIFIEHDPGFSRFEPEITVLICTLIIHGHVELASDLAARFQWYCELIENSIMLNGSQSVYDRCMEKFKRLDRDWLQSQKESCFPEPPLFSLDLARSTSIWSWFEEDNELVFTDALIKFIIQVGELRSTVGLDLILSSFFEISFHRDSKSPKTLQVQLFQTAGHIEIKMMKQLRKTYAGWNDPKAQEFLRNFILPLEEKVNAIAYFF